MDINAAGGSMVGVSDEQIDALPDHMTSPLFNEDEHLALELADVMSAGSVEISDGLFARLRARFDEAQLVELAATAAMENFRARFNRVFQIEPNGLYCPIDKHAPAQE